MNGDMCFQVRRHWYRHPILEEHGCGVHRGRTRPQHGRKLVLILVFFLGRSKGYISMIMVDGLHSVDLGTGAHIVGNIFLEKLRCMGAQNMGDNIKILDRQMRAWNQVHNPNVSHVRGDLTINRAARVLWVSEAKATAAAVDLCVPFALELAKRHHDSNRHNQQVLVVGERLQTFYSIVLTVAEKKSTRRRACWNFVLSVSPLHTKRTPLAPPSGRQLPSCICCVIWEWNNHRVGAILVSRGPTPTKTSWVP